MLTRKAAAISSLAILSIVIGTAVQNPLLVSASIPLITYLAVCLFYAQETHSNISINRTADKTVIYEGEMTEIKFEINNEGPQKLDVVEIIDKVPSKNLEIISGSNHHIFGIASHEKISFSYSLKPNVHGLYEIGPILVTITDTQGLIVQKKILEEILLLKVFPRIQYVPKVNIRPRRTRSWPGEILSRKPGMGSEFYGLKNYEFGDPLNRLNWKKTSKFSDQIFTNQFMSELGGDSVIVLDARSISEVGDPPDSILTYSVRAAAILAHRILRDRNRVGAIILGSTLDKVRPGFGKRQFDRILIALARTKPGMVWDISNLGDYLSLFFSTMVQIVFISPLVDEDAVTSVIEVAAKGYQVLVISPSPVKIEMRNIFSSSSSSSSSKKRDEVHGLGERLLRVERENKLDLLRRSAAVVDWDVDTPLSTALQHAAFAWNIRGSEITG